MRLIRKSRSLLLLCLLCDCGTADALASPHPHASAIDLAQRQMTAYLAKLADLHCTETVTQQKLAANGHVQATERAKYDYLIMMSGSGDDFQLNESRIESAADITSSRNCRCS